MSKLFKKRWTKQDIKSKIEDDRTFLGTFIMSFNGLLTHLFRYYYMYYSVRLTENAINPSFIIYITSRKGDSFNNLHYTLHLLWNNVLFHMKLFYKMLTVFYKIQLAPFWM